MYESGRGVARDEVEALKWIRLAAAQNNAEAQYRLGDMYEHGRILGIDYAQALHWYRRAESNNYAGAEESRERVELLAGTHNKEFVREMFPQVEDAKQKAAENELLRKVGEQIEDAKRKASGTVAP
jgi:TPR repeat protein